MFLKDAIVLRLQQICRERNIRYNELANRSGVTPSTVYSLMSPSRRVCHHVEETLRWAGHDHHSIF